METLTLAKRNIYLFKLLEIKLFIPSVTLEVAFEQYVILTGIKIMNNSRRTCILTFEIRNIFWLLNFVV